MRSAVFGFQFHRPERGGARLIGLAAIEQGQGQAGMDFRTRGLGVKRRAVVTGRGTAVTGGLGLGGPQEVLVGLREAKSPELFNRSAGLGVTAQGVEDDNQQAPRLAIGGVRHEDALHGFQSLFEAPGLERVERGVEVVGGWGCHARDGRA